MHSEPKEELKELKIEEFKQKQGLVEDKQTKIIDSCIDFKIATKNGISYSNFFSL